MVRVHGTRGYDGVRYFRSGLVKDDFENLTWTVRRIFAGRVAEVAVRRFVSD